MNVDVGDQWQKKKRNKQERDKAGKDMSAKYREVLITFLHCHSKLLDSVGMSDQ